MFMSVVLTAMLHPEILRCGGLFDVEDVTCTNYPPSIQQANNYNNLNNELKMLLLIN